MKHNAMSKVYELSDKYLLNYAAPNHKIIIELLQFDAANFDAISNQKLSQYIFVLGQFIISVQYQENLKAAEYIINKKHFEHIFNKKRFERSAELKELSKATEKEKYAWLLEHDEELKQLDYEVLLSEVEKTALSDMVKSYEGLLNVLKKEISTRVPE